MSLEAIITIAMSAAALVISLTSAVFVFLRLKFSRQQMKVDAWARIIQNNRDILSMGFADEDVWNVMEGKRIKSKTKEARIAQLFLNQAAVIFHAWDQGLLHKEHWSAAKLDIHQTMQIASLQERWRQAEFAYDAKFKKFMNEILETQPRKI